MIFDEEDGEVVPLENKQKHDHDNLMEDDDEEDWSGVPEAHVHDPTTCDHEACHAEETEAAESSIFLIMFSVMAVMLFIMWMMLRRCQNPTLDDEDDVKRKRGSYVPTRISAVDDNSVEM